MRMDVFSHAPKPNTRIPPILAARAHLQPDTSLPPSASHAHAYPEPQFYPQPQPTRLDYITAVSQHNLARLSSTCDPDLRRFVGHLKILKRSSQEAGENIRRLQEQACESDSEDEDEDEDEYGDETFSNYGNCYEGGCPLDGGDGGGLVGYGFRYGYTGGDVEDPMLFDEEPAVQQEEEVQTEPRPVPYQASVLAAFSSASVMPRAKPQPQVQAPAQTRRAASPYPAYASAPVTMTVSPPTPAPPVVSHITPQAQPAGVQVQVQAQAQTQRKDEDKDEDEDRLEEKDNPQDEQKSPSHSPSPSSPPMAGSIPSSTLSSLLPVRTSASAAAAAASVPPTMTMKDKLCSTMKDILIKGTISPKTKTKVKCTFGLLHGQNAASYSTLSLSSLSSISSISSTPSITTSQSDMGIYTKLKRSSTSSLPVSVRILEDVVKGSHEHDHDDDDEKEKEGERETRARSLSPELTRPLTPTTTAKTKRMNQRGRQYAQRFGFKVSAAVPVTT